MPGDAEALQPARHTPGQERLSRTGGASLFSGDRALAGFAVGVEQLGERALRAGRYQDAVDKYSRSLERGELAEVQVELALTLCELGGSIWLGGASSAPWSWIRP